VSALLASAAPSRRFPSALIDRVRLADGREVVLRPVLDFDAGAEQRFFSQALLPLRSARGTAVDAARDDRGRPR
jgi:hypothetical protein